MDTLGLIELSRPCKVISLSRLNAHLSYGNTDTKDTSNLHYTRDLIS